ncbi:hypothetical protein [Chromohalobacter moromii]|uniref:Uncharacterized protein n=1 Tax=Chromohalobacter moromii TaxID=2860329 RepID=A0A9X3B4P5_9GAMM|nr:hypothetical protein [Chromohalobacter moromii]MCT8506159.1 hypothetical protein [Chromohalobacter moromii]
MTTDRQRMGGRQARRAAILCNDKRFRLYLDARRRNRNRMTREQLPDGTHSAEDAADFIRDTCGISSRAVLDHNDAARQMFVRIIEDYTRWQRHQQQTRG